MSTLHEAARRVVSAWVSTRPAWIEQCNEAVLALDAALKAEPAQEPSESSCDECGKSKADGWALYCVECLEQFFRPAEPAQEIDVYSYAALLATAIHAKHYKDTAPQWKPLPDLLGVLTQIDNMTAGLTRQPEPAQEPVAWAHPTQGFVRWRTETIQPEVVASYERAGWTPLSLYTTTPQPQRPPLTDEEISDIYIDWDITPGRRIADLVRAIERKLKGE